MTLTQAAVREGAQCGARPIRVLVVDDHPLVRSGIAALTASKTDIEVVAQASSGEEAVELFRMHEPDVTLMDLQMPGLHGMDAIQAIRQMAPEAAIIVLTTYSGDVQIRRAMEAGARAYLLKNLLHKELIEAIRCVHAGRRTMSPDVAAALADYSLDEPLTDRELEVLQLVALGLANKEIGAQLEISEEAVKSRVRSVLAKLRANDRTHAVMIALRRGILTL